MRQFASPYLYAGNGFNPINSVDFNGEDQVHISYDSEGVQSYQHIVDDNPYSLSIFVNGELSESFDFSDEVETFQGDVIGIEGSWNFTFAGGADLSWQYAYFPSTKETHFYFSPGASLGFNLGVGFDVFRGTLKKPLGNEKIENAFGGEFQSISAGIGIFSGAYSWSEYFSVFSGGAAFGGKIEAGMSYKTGNTKEINQ
jgi:hypothetical protein